MRPGSPWEAHRLTQEEWRECEASAREVRLATGVRVTVQEVAAQYAQARAFEAQALAALVLAPRAKP